MMLHSIALGSEAGISPSTKCSRWRWLKGQVERRNAGREGCERKQKRRPALHPLERVVTRPQTRVAP
jgi:hypothetical protein